MFRHMGGILERESRAKESGDARRFRRHMHLTPRATTLLND
jgi:hypothetical protein